MKKQMSVETLKQLIAYDPKTGMIKRLVFHKGVGLRGWFAGTLTTKGYRRFSLYGRVYLVHRVAWAITYGEWPACEIDHQDGVRSNNKLNNLREATTQINMLNKKKYCNNSTGTPGVTWFKNYSKYVVVISILGRRKCLGYYETLDEAVAVRKAAEVQYGYHANHGRDK